MLARGVHRLSQRAGPFVAANCGAIPQHLVESQLFGHVRGAFTGALKDEPGLVRSAQHGTLLLDEIGDLPASSQAALLRVLQESEVRPLGTTHTTTVDVRIIAATHMPLEDLIERGAFRRDLYARLAGYTFTLAPLRPARRARWQPQRRRPRPAHLALAARTTDDAPRDRRQALARRARAAGITSAPPEMRMSRSPAAARA